MPIQSVNLPQHQAEYIRQRVATGRFQDADEVIRAGLRLLEQQESENELKLKVLREAIDVGLADIDQGRSTTLETAGDIEAFMDSVSARPKQG